MKRLSRAQLLAVAGAAVVLLGLVVVMYATSVRDQQTAQTSPSPSVSSSPDPEDFDPKEDSEQAQRTESPTPKPAVSGTPTPTPAGKTVKPVIVAVDDKNGQISIDALVDPATSGTCTATMTKGSSVVKATSTVTTLGAGSYACSTLRISKSSLSAGNWELVVSLAGSDGSGSSDKRMVTVQ